MQKSEIESRTHKLTMDIVKMLIESELSLNDQLKVLKMAKEKVSKESIKEIDEKLIEDYFKKCQIPK